MTLSYTTARSGKINISTDGEFRFAVSAVIWYSFNFTDGGEITEEELLEVKAASDRHDAYEKALNLLSFRAHSAKELYMKLKMKFPSSAARDAVDRCEAAGLIDDEKFAELLAEELYRRKHYAPIRIISELENRGVDKNTAENAVFALDIDRESGIIRILDKMRVNDESSEKDKARAYRRLLNAGYSYSEINKFLN